MVMLLTYGGVGGAHDFNLDIDVTNLPSRREALEKICQPVPGVHGRAKRVSPETIAKANDNEPFEDFPRMNYAWKRACGEDGTAKDKFNRSIRNALENFLRRAYYNLATIAGISFDIENVSEKDEREVLEEAVESYLAASLDGQADWVREAYDGLRALRTVFRDANRRDCLSVEHVIPSRYLPELLMAAPVWFVEPKEKPEDRPSGWNSEIIKYFCDLSGSYHFAHLFQMYNLEPRYISEYRGPELMPLHIVKLVEEVKGLFDFLVIATPYHDLATRGWQDSGWVRNIDPFLFGFLKQIPECMFFLGRWSGTGLFPLMSDMIGDTVEHIRKNKMLLSNFAAEINWYRTQYGNGIMFGPYLMPVTDYQMQGDSDVSDGGKWKKEDHSLVKFANRLLEQFDQGSLFPWLRDESK